MTSLSLLSLLLLACSAMDFPPGHCDGALSSDWMDNIIGMPSNAKECKNLGGKCCSDYVGVQNPKYPPFDATKSAYQDLQCQFCWKTQFVPDLQTAPSTANEMVCSDTKPHDMGNVEVHHANVNGVLTKKYCSSSPVLTASAADAPQAYLWKSKCPDKILSFLPGRGYNILTGMPLPFGENAVDPGYLNSPVFKPTFDDCQTTGNQKQSGYWEWTIPDNFIITSLNTLTSGRQSTSMHDEHSFQNQAKSSLQVSGGGSAFGVDMEFTAGAEWGSSVASFSDGDNIEQRYHRTAYAYKITANPYMLDLHEAYLKTFASAYLSNDWTLFFMSYGTHVTTEVTTGARYSQVSKFTRTKFEELNSNEAAYNAGVKASYEGATGSIESKTEESTKKRKMLESYVNEQFMVSTGGDGAALDASSDQTMVQYLQSAYNFPAPLAASVVPHDVLIQQDQFWTAFQDAVKASSQGNANAVTKEDFEQKWLEAIQTYCGDEAHKCQKASSLDAPEPMTLTNFASFSEVYGIRRYMKNPQLIHWTDMPKFAEYKPLIKISKIHTYCANHNGLGRLRGLQFEYFDGDRSAYTPILGIQGDSDADTGGKPWADSSNTIGMNEFISAVEIESGDDVDGIWFHVQSWKDSSTRKIGCGYTSGTTKIWNIKSDNKLLGFQAESDDLNGMQIVKWIQFESLLYIVPTVTAGGPQCQCYGPNSMSSSGAKCSNGDFLWCDKGSFCQNNGPFPLDQLQCSASYNLQSTALPSTTTQETDSVAAHHEKLLQQIEYKRSLRKSSAVGSGKGKPSVSAAPPKAKKDSAHNHKKWDDAKHNIKSAVKDMSKSLKHDLKSELKDVLAKELKEALGHLQQKQTHLESTVTRMLMHEVESY